MAKSSMPVAISYGRLILVIAICAEVMAGHWVFAAMLALFLTYFLRNVVDQRPRVTTVIVNRVYAILFLLFAVVFAFRHEWTGCLVVLWSAFFWWMAHLEQSYANRAKLHEAEGVEVEASNS